LNGFALHHAVFIEDDLGEGIGWAVKPSFEVCLLLREIPSDRVSIDDGPGFNQINPDRHDRTGSDIRAAPAAHQSRELTADVEIRVLHGLFSGSINPPHNV
jgi:hypothetical protein